MINREQHRAQIDDDRPLTNTAGYGVGIQRSFEPYAWRAVYVHHLSPAENGNMHNVFIDVLDMAGDIWANADNLRVGWTWEGRRADEAAPLRPFEKNPPEPRAQLDLYRGARVACWIENTADNLADSDIVFGLRSDVQDVPNNSLYHNSFVVLFRWGPNPDAAGPTEPPPVGPPSGCAEWVNELRAIVAGLERQVADLRAVIDAMQGDI